MMLKIAFNYHDSIVQLRFAALLAAAIMIACLAVLEFKKPLSLRLKLGLGAVFILGGAIMLYAVATLQGV
jgi:hypothetical protein